MSADKSYDAKVIKASAALTAAYASGWASSLINVGAAQFGRLLLDITKGDATSIELRFVVEDQAGTTGYKSFKVSEGAASLDEVTITASDLGTTDTIAIDLDLRGVRKFAVQAKKTGGTGTVNLAAKLVLHTEAAWV